MWRDVGGGGGESKLCPINPGKNKVNLARLLLGKGKKKYLGEISNPRLCFLRFWNPNLFYLFDVGNLKVKI